MIQNMTTLEGSGTANVCNLFQPGAARGSSGRPHRRTMRAVDVEWTRGAHGRASRLRFATETKISMLYRGPNMPKYDGIRSQTLS